MRELWALLRNPASENTQCRNIPTAILVSTWVFTCTHITVCIYLYPYTCEVNMNICTYITHTYAFKKNPEKFRWSWGNGSVYKTTSTQAGEPEFNPQKPSKRSWIWWCVLVIPALRKWRQVDVWASLTSQHSQISKLQTNKRPCLKKKSG